MIFLKSKSMLHSTHPGNMCTSLFITSETGQWSELLQQCSESRALKQVWLRTQKWFMRKLIWSALVNWNWLIIIWVKPEKNATTSYTWRVHVLQYVLLILCRMLYNNIMNDQVPVSQKSLHEHAIQCHVVRLSMGLLVYHISTICEMSFTILWSTITMIVYCMFT